MLSSPLQYFEATQAIDIMNIIWLLTDKSTSVCFVWIPSRCGIDGNERLDQLPKKTLAHDIDPPGSVHHADMRPLVNSYIQQLVQINRVWLYMVETYISWNQI